MIFVTYDPALPYPQPALFGLGVVSGGVHIPNDGTASFGVARPSLNYGLDERFYEVTDIDTLAERDQASIDAIVADDEQKKADAALLAQSRADDRAAANANHGKIRAVPAINEELDRLTNIIEGLQ